MRPFRCPVTILNTIDHLGKFNGKADEDFFVGYSLNSKAFRVFNSRTRIVEENLHIRFSESTPNVVGSGPDWLFDIDALTRTMNYEPIVAGTQSNGFADPKSYHDDGSKPSSDDGKKVDEDPRKDSECKDQEKEDNVNSTNNVNNVSSTVNAAGTNEVNDVGGKTSIKLLFDLNMPALEDDSIFDLSRDDEDDGAVADINNLDTTIQVGPNPTTRIHKDHPLDQVIRDLQSATQTRKMSKNLEEHGFEEPKKVIHALKDPSWIEVMQEELLQFKIEEEVYVCQPPGFEDPDFPNRVYKVEKALYGLHQAPKAWYEKLSIYLLDSGFQRGKIDKTLFIKRYKGDILLVQVYVDDIIFGSTKKELCIAFEKLMHEKFQMSSMGELTLFLGLQVEQKKDGIFICEDKYVAKILKKFGFTEVKTASTPMETQKPLLMDEDSEEVDVHMYRSMICSLMYLTSSRPDITFAVCACARYQVNPKVLHLYAVKRIFRYLKGQPKLGLWYPKDSLFDLVAYTDSDYAGASLDRKSTTGGSTNPTDPHHTPTFIQPSPQPQKTQQPRTPKRKDAQVPQSSDHIENVTDEAVYKELGDSLVVVPGAKKPWGILLLKLGLRVYINILMIHCSQEKTKTTQHNEIASLKRRVKKLEKKNRSRTRRLKRLYKVGLTARVESSDNEEGLGEDASKQGRIDVIDADEEITLVSVHDVNVSASEEVFATTIDDITLAQVLEEMKSTKPKKKGVVIQELGESTITISSIFTTITRQRLTREKPEKEKEANIALIETRDDIQTKIDVDHQLAERMQAQEQEELSIKENATLFQQLLEKRRKNFAAKRAEEKRNKPPTKAQEKKIMCTYLKNMEGYKLKDLKLKEFDSIQEMFDRAFKRVNTFEDFRTQLVKGKEKRAGTELK
ncbi:putative ribonuclease H-like domain-containing protein [Tanacetum coccineum]|uniref:Ribonuclease H-like domain-containing protein n=1 Tax=Tanacetum coccineum TaxID=301880 RepID=A0ABQ5GXK6_9ASTR